MGGVRRVPERCESPKGLEQEGIAECESDPQRDDFEGLGDVATSLTMEMIVRRIREVEKLELIRFGKRRDGGVGDAVGAEEALPRLRREIKPMENLGEEEVLKVRSKWRSIVVAHAVEKTVAERNWELGSGDQGRVLGVRHTERPPDDPEHLREATDEGDVDIGRVTQDITEGKTRKAGLRGHREATALRRPGMIRHSTAFQEMLPSERQTGPEGIAAGRSGSSVNPQAGERDQFYGLVEREGGKVT